MRGNFDINLQRFLKDFSSGEFMQKLEFFEENLKKQRSLRTLKRESRILEKTLTYLMKLPNKLTLKYPTTLGPSLVTKNQ